MKSEKYVMLTQENLNTIIDTILELDFNHDLPFDSQMKLEALRNLYSDNHPVEPAIGPLLKQLGVRPGILGYDYLKTAIKLALVDRSLIQNITKELYPAIAKAHNTTSSRAERAMRHAVEIAFDAYGDDMLRDAIFGNSTDPNKGKPTNTHFIAAVVEYLSEE